MALGHSVNLVSAGEDNGTVKVRNSSIWQKPFDVPVSPTVCFEIFRVHIL
jgi:hypothetical protein